jgi:retinol dehydrogenase-12
MKGKVCLVTGATSGIGEVTARELAAQGATVVVVGRAEERVKATLDMIRGRVPGADLHPMVADLSTGAPIVGLAASFRKQFDRLDVLVNNAGAVFYSRQESAEGHEMSFALNHLGYFRLTQHLIDLLKKTPGARIVNVASHAHYSGKMDFEDLHGKRKYSPMKAYSQSKLANILFTRELSRQLAGTGVTANSLHPGVVATRFGLGNAQGGFVARLVHVGMSVFGISSEKGARTMLHLATSPDVTGVTGKYFASSREKTPSAAALDDAAARRLWELSVAVS